MSDNQTIAGYGAGFAAASASTSDPRAAIARAAAATGVDFRYLLAQAKLESSLDPSAHAGTSSAAGLYQFTSGTWLQTLDKHGAEHGLDWAGAAISGGRVTDPALSGAISRLRYDADASSLMAAELARDNGAALTTQLGRQPDAAELYLAHFLGAAGAGTFLSRLASDPDASAAALLPKAAAANPTIFYGAGGAPRSLSQTMALLRGKLETAMGDEGGTWAAGTTPQAPIAADNVPHVAGYAAPAWAGSVGREFHEAAAPAASSAPTPSGQGSMATSLDAMFGISADPAGAPDAVRSAYARFKAWEL